MQPLRLAYFISPHGYGHATRSAAILEAMFRKWTNLRVTLFSQVPAFIFDALPQDHLTFVQCACDVGLAQKSATEINESETLERLTHFWPPKEDAWKGVLAQLEKGHFAGIISDISPLGIWLAEKVGLPSVLIENFTWDWIYRGLNPQISGLQRFASSFEACFARVGLRIQTEPFCVRSETAQSVGPVARALRVPAEVLRGKVLGERQGALVLVTMGGLMQTDHLIRILGTLKDATILLPGSSVRKGNIYGLGEASTFYHPDWVAAADLVLGKLGYSTVAEAYQGRTPFGYIDRPDFPESAVLAEYLASKNSAFLLPSMEPSQMGAAIRQGCAMPRGPRRELTGADEAAEIILKFLSR